MPDTTPTVTVTTGDAPAAADSGVGAHRQYDYAPAQGGPTPTQAAAPAAEVPAAPQSPLRALRDMRKPLDAAMHLDLRVPRWGERAYGYDNPFGLYVRYNPTRPAEHADRIEKRQKQHHKPKDWIVAENAQVLVDACVGVFLVWGEEPLTRDDTREKYSLRENDPTGAWTRFDPELAESLGLEHHVGAIAVVRALYPTQADLVTAANTLNRWSGVRTEDADEAFLGG